MPMTRRRRANSPDQPENNEHLAEQTNNATDEQQLTNGQDAQAPVSPSNEPPAEFPGAEQVEHAVVSPAPPISPANGDRVERQEPAPSIESGRRTARGELFRRPPQPPPQAPAAYTPPPTLQAPTHEISLPLGNLLHLAYNPGFTGSDEARSHLLNQLANESKAGGRARCWNCGSIAIVYDRWNTRSKTFGEVGIAFCEICGVWSVM